MTSLGPWRPLLICAAALLLCLTRNNPVFPSGRSFEPMGYYVRQAALIAVVDISPGGAKGLETIVTLTDIIKGDPAKRGQQVVLPALTRLNSSEVYLPHNAHGIAVLFGPGWTPRTPALMEVYREPREIAALRTLVPIYAMPSERLRLTALRDAARLEPATNGKS